MIFDLSSLYQECQKRLQVAKQEWGDDPYFSPRFQFHRNDVIVEQRGEEFHFFVTHCPDHAFAILSRDHVLIRAPSWKRHAPEKRRQGGAYESSVLQGFFGVRVYAGNPNHPGHVFKASSHPDVQTVEWIWSDGKTMRAHGPQLVRVLDRKELKRVKEQINEITAATRTLAKLSESRTDVRYTGNYTVARKEAIDAIANGENIDPQEMAELLMKSTWAAWGSNDAARIERALRDLQEDLWRRLGAVQLVEKEAA